MAKVKQGEFKMGWYVYQSNASFGENYRPRSLQKNIGKLMVRLFHYRGFFCVYVFKGEDCIDMNMFDNRPEALNFANIPADCAMATE